MACKRQGARDASLKLTGGTLEVAAVTRLIFAEASRSRHPPRMDRNIRDRRSCCNGRYLPNA